MTVKKNLLQIVWIGFRIENYRPFYCGQALICVKISGDFVDGIVYVQPNSVQHPCTGLKYQY